MTSFRLVLFCLIAATTPGFSQQVRFWLADKAVVVDASPSVAFDADLVADIRAQLQVAFPGSLLDIKPGQALNPDERVVVLIPTLVAARVAQETTAGTIQRLESAVVASLTAMDPWTEATLFSATRMVSGQVEVGRSEKALAADLVRQAFRQASARWADVCVGQLKARFAPFVLSAPTLAPPTSGLPSIWPYGSLRGVMSGALLAGPDRIRARVLQVFPRYALIEDALDPKRRIPVGERYALTVVSTPTERPEPRVALHWRGAQPPRPAGLKLPPLPSAAFLGLAEQYLSQGGGLRVLPPLRLDPRTAPQLRRVSDALSRQTTLAQVEDLSVQRETLTELAKENPEWRVDIGILNGYHGLRRRPDGRIEHYFRLHMAAAILLRADEGSLYPLHQVLEQEEEWAQEEQAGVRALDVDAAWFTVCRNAVVRLAGKVRTTLEAVPRQGLSLLEASINKSGAPDWPTAKPGPHAPLTWLRPVGEVLTPEGSLGPCYKLMLPSQGFLTPSNLAKENLKPGDVLRFSGASSETPLVGLLPAQGMEAPAWMPDPAWWQPLAAKALQGEARCRFVLDPQPTLPRHVAFWGEKLAIGSNGDGSLLSGQWRLRVLPAPGTPDLPPTLKFGFQTEQRPVGTASQATLQPVDQGRLGLEFLRRALAQMAETGRTKDLSRAILAPLSPEAP